SVPLQPPASPRKAPPDQLSKASPNSPALSSRTRSDKRLEAARSALSRRGSKSRIRVGPLVHLYETHQVTQFRNASTTVAPREEGRPPPSTIAPFRLVITPNVPN